MSHKKQFGILLVIVFLLFACQGLPNSILGAAWSPARAEMNLPLAAMGILSTLVLCSSALSSIIGPSLLKRFGLGKVAIASAVCNIVALIGYALSPSFLFLAIFSVPLGLGQGALNTGLNQYVANRCTSRQMNWMHCVWSIGASIGPLIISQALALNLGWRTGYFTIGVIFLAPLIISIVCALKNIWGNYLEPSPEQSEPLESSKFTGIRPYLSILLFFLYTGVEYSASVWIGSMLTESRQIAPELAGLSGTFLFAAIMAGRFLTGIVANRLGNMAVIRIGILIAVIGSICLSLAPNFALAMASVILIGLGFSPIYPCLLHETPKRFSRGVSNRLIGYQVGAAFLGGSVISSGMGVLLSAISLEILPFLLILVVAAIFFINEILTRKTQK